MWRIRSWYGTAMLTALLIAAAAVPAQRPVSFLLVITDDQRNDMLGCAGHPILQTPEMDALAARGTRFENAFVTTPICAASRASILASRYEANHGFTFGTPPIPSALTEDSWPVRLRGAGWRTGHIGKWGMKTEENARGLYDTFIPTGAPYFKKAKDGTVQHLTNITGDHALAFLDELDEEQPFALTISFNAPHADDPNPLQYVWAEEEDELYGDVDIPLPDLATEDAFAALPPFLQSAMGRKRWGWRFDSEEKRVRMTRGYYRMISGIDRNLGRVMRRLDELERTGDTVVIFLGDNGYFLGERGLAGKWLIYEESIRVPMIVIDPRTKEDARRPTTPEAVLNIDVGPTIMDLAGFEVPKGYQGMSLAPLLSGQPTEWRNEFLVEHHMDNAIIPKHRGLRGERWVYSLFYEQSPPYEQLFDLENDPQQLQNLAGVAAHEDKLIELRERTTATADRLASGLNKPAESPVDDKR
ncbi:MAG: arylsulfatase A-like enzyme [Paracoccaceae bacterium]|jgi:arylsulfatase A-like enzyme